MAKQPTMLTNEDLIKAGASRNDTNLAENGSNPYQDSDEGDEAIAGLEKEGRIEEAACWAHTRRKFYEVTVANERASIAQAVLEQIGKIYGIEEEIRGLPAEQRKEERNVGSRVLVEKLFRGFKKAYDELPQKSSTAKAIVYALNNEKALLRFLDNGQIEIDNNIAERARRSIAVGRKNWLFAGSDNRGNKAATIYSIIETVKLNGINPWKYLGKVLAVNTGSQGQQDRRAPSMENNTLCNELLVQTTFAERVRYL